MSRGIAPQAEARPAGSAAEPRATGPLGLTVGAAFGGLVLLGLVGWVAWNQGALVGLRWVEFDAPLTLAAFGFVAGVGAFFAPCAFALFPAYVSYYLGAAATGRGGLGRSLTLGGSCLLTHLRRDSLGEAAGGHASAGQSGEGGGARGVRRREDLARETGSGDERVILPEDARPGDVIECHGARHRVTYEFGAWALERIGS